MTDNVSPIISELRRGYVEISKLYPNPLPMPVINTPNKDRRRKGWSWYTPDSWESLGSDILNAFMDQENEGVIESKSEMCFAAEGLGMGERELLIEIAHQTVHHINYVTHCKDTSCGVNYDGKPIENPVSIEGFYHNRWFYDTCKVIGLTPHLIDTGMYRFDLSEELQDCFSGIQLDQGVFDLNRREAMLTRKTRTGMRLYECAHGQKIRAATYNLKATCNVCGYWFVYADNDATPAQQQSLKDTRKELKDG